jgi:hypothetical protein
MPRLNIAKLKSARDEFLLSPDAFRGIFKVRTLQPFGTEAGLMVPTEVRATSTVTS